MQAATAEGRAPDSTAAQPGGLSSQPVATLAAVTDTAPPTAPADAPRMDVSAISNMIANNDVSALRSMAQTGELPLRINSAEDAPPATPAAPPQVLLGPFLEFRLHAWQCSSRHLPYGGPGVKTYLNRCLLWDQL